MDKMVISKNQKLTKTSILQQKKEAENALDRQISSKKGQLETLNDEFYSTKLLYDRLNAEIEVFEKQTREMNLLTNELEKNTRLASRAKEMRMAEEEELNRLREDISVKSNILTETSNRIRISKIGEDQCKDSSEMAIKDLEKITKDLDTKKESKMVLDEELINLENLRQALKNKAEAAENEKTRVINQIEELKKEEELKLDELSKLKSRILFENQAFDELESKKKDNKDALENVEKQIDDQDRVLKDTINLKRNLEDEYFSLVEKSNKLEDKVNIQEKFLETANLKLSEKKKEMENLERLSHQKMIVLEAEENKINIARNDVIKMILRNKEKIDKKRVKEFMEGIQDGN